MIAAKSRAPWPYGVTVQHAAIRLLLAVGLAAAAFVMTQSWTDSRAGATGPVPTVKVLVTAHAIEAGRVIAATDLRWQSWPSTLIDPHWLVPQAGPSALIGQVAPVRLAAGVPVTREMAVARGTGSAFAAMIAPGSRAVSLAVTPAGGLAGFVEPGDRVDVLLTQTIGGRRTAQTLIVDIGVLGVDQRRRGDGPTGTASDVIAEAALDGGVTPPELVTLEVTPRQAEALAVASELGKLSLALRGPGREPRPAGGRRWDSDVTGLSAAQLAAANAQPTLAAAPVVAAPLRPGADAVPARGGFEVVYGIAASEAVPATAVPGETK